ncbi:MAG: hypothetical protein ACXWBN_08920 [Acidimicrobiales bacterium]
MELVVALAEHPADEEQADDDADHQQLLAIHPALTRRRPPHVPMTIGTPGGRRERGPPF